MCISQFQNCTDGSKDPLFSRRPFIQSFPSQCITRNGSEKRIAYAEEQIEIYLAAMEQQDGTDIDIKEKLEAYQQ